MKNINVLIAEDIGVTAMGLKLKLERMGYNVVGTAASGEEAVALAEENGPDVVLMDIKLKGMDGIEAAKQIIKSLRIPIIFTSAFSDEKTRERIDKLGACEFIDKPYTGEELENALNKVFAYGTKA